MGNKIIKILKFWLKISDSKDASKNEWDCERNFKLYSMQRWQCPICNEMDINVFDSLNWAENFRMLYP